MSNSSTQRQLTIRSAMVLAAGLGQRMRPLSDHVPKPLIELNGRPMIDYALDALEAADISRIVVNVHYLAGLVEAHLAQRTKPEILVSDERGKLLDSGGGVKKALPLLGNAPFLSLNSDAVWLDGPRANLKRLMESWNESEMDILLLVSSTASAVGWGNRGDFGMDQHGRLHRPKAGEIAPFAYTGIAVTKPALFANTPEVFSLNLLFDRAIARGRLFGLRLEGLFMHVGTPGAIDEASRRLLEASL